MPAEITIICKGEDRTYRQKFLEYCEDRGPISLDQADGLLRGMVAEAAKNYSADGEKPDTIVVKAEMVWE